MPRSIQSSIRQSIRIALPAIVFFLAGASAVYRQGYGYRIEAELRETEETNQTLRSVRSELLREIAQLQSRNRILDLAKTALHLQQPNGEAIVILQVGSAGKPIP